MMTSTMLENLKNLRRWEGDVEDVEALQRAIEEWYEWLSLSQRDRYPQEEGQAAKEGG